MKSLFISILVVLISLSSSHAAAKGKHLFILSGQSNMKYLDPTISFIPAVEAAFGKDKVIVVHDAQGGQPIRRWYKKWVPADGKKPASTGDLYKRLMRKMKPILKKQNFSSVTFVWMQGEADAQAKHGEVYADSLRGLIQQFRDDLGHENINVVIGRLSDCDMTNKHFPHWTIIRDIQVEVAESNPRSLWVNTDDLNDGKGKNGRQLKNNLHYSVEGYKKLGERFAAKSIELIKKHD